MAGYRDVRADDRTSDIEQEILCRDLQGQVQSAEGLSTDRQYAVVAVLFVHSAVGHDDESIRDAVYERDPAVVYCQTGTSGDVALVVRADGSAPRAALWHHRFKAENRAVRIVLGVVMTGISVYGFYLFFKSDMLNYMLFKNLFAFLDYEKAWWLVLLENLSMLLAWGFAAYLISLFLRSITHKGKRKSALLYALLLIVVIVGGIVLNTALNPQQNSATPSWSAPQNDPTQSGSPTQAVSKDNKGLSFN